MNEKSNSLISPRRVAFGAAIIAGALLVKANAGNAPLPVVEKVDLTRYQGQWYEIARLPMFFEKKCDRDITANYTLNADQTVRVDNRCIQASGEPKQSIGQAKPADASGAKLKVTFLPEGLRWLPFGQADYWILKLDPDYQVALVGEPRRRYLWLLSRTPQLDTATKTEYLNYAKSQGYDLSELITPKQTGTAPATP